jgi:hypothetical protein
MLTFSLRSVQIHKVSSGQSLTRVSRRLDSKAERGSAVLESALVLPLVMLLACGAMDFARVFFAGIVVESAARSGVQLGSFSMGKAGALSDMNAAADTEAAGQGLTGVTTSSRTFCGCVNSTSEVSCSTATCSGAIPDGYVETTARYTYNPIIPYPGIPRNVLISSSVRFRAQ